MQYDPNESRFPAIGVPIAVTIGQCEEKQSSSGRDMLVMNITVNEGQPGVGYETRFNAMSFHLGAILRAVGMDDKGARKVDALTFRGKIATVTFKHEEYTNKHGEQKVATKVDEWLPIVAAPVPAAPAEDDTPPPPSADEEPPIDDSDIPF